MTKQTRRTHLFCGFCFSLLCFCLLIILWGAWVRISHSGDGCGQSWPSCQGKYLINSADQDKTWVEWTHRATSGLFGIMVVLLVLWSFFKFSFRHPVFKSSLCVLFFTVSEALIGARLVLAGLTGNNDSPTRMFTMNLHLLNSLLLTSSLFVCWRFSLGKSFSLSVFSKKKKYLIISICTFFLIAFFGSMSSLSSSLFPSQSLWEGALLDFDSQSHWLVRLRLLHPLLALVFGGGFLLYYFSQDIKIKSRSQQILVFCVGLTLISGLMNLLLLSPVFLKLTHLLVIYLLSMSFILTLEKHL